MVRLGDAGFSWDSRFDRVGLLSGVLHKGEALGQEGNALAMVFSFRWNVVLEAHYFPVQLRESGVS